jgi:hypothetical protein
MSNLTAIRLAERLKKEGEKVIAYFSMLTDEQWKTEIYTEGDIWTIRNVLAHFVTAERGLLKLFERIRQGGPGVADDFSIDRYNARQQQKARDLTIPELMQQFVEVRANSVEWVSGLSEEELLFVGRHPFLGEVPLIEMIKMLYLHNQIHFRDFRKLVE